MSGDGHAGYIWVRMGTMGSRDTGEHQNKERRDKKMIVQGMILALWPGKFPRKDIYMCGRPKGTQMGTGG